MEETTKKKQDCAYFYRVFVAICGVSRTILSRTRSHILHHIDCGIIANYDSNLFCIIFLVAESSKIRFEEKKRLDSPELQIFHESMPIGPSNVWLGYPSRLEFFVQFLLVLSSLVSSCLIFFGQFQGRCMQSYQVIQKCIY